MAANLTIFAVVLILGHIAYAINYSDCGSEVGKLDLVVVSNCENTRRCILKRNTNVTMELTFTSNVDSDSLTAVVHGVILSIPMPFDLPNADGCKDSNVACPIKAGQTYKYIANLPVSESYPKVTVDVKWELKDKDDKDVICAFIPSKIA